MAAIAELSRIWNSRYNGGGSQFTNTRDLQYALAVLILTT
jgi:hypothetical protein